MRREEGKKLQKKYRQGREPANNKKGKPQTPNNRKKTKPKQGGESFQSLNGKIAKKGHRKKRKEPRTE